MTPARLFSARLRTVFEDVGHWALSTWAGLKPSRRLPQQASPRLLSVGHADHAKHQELPGKKPLSEKKLPFEDRQQPQVRLATRVLGRFSARWGHHKGFCGVNPGLRALIIPGFHLYALAGDCSKCLVARPLHGAPSPASPWVETLIWA
ncbi:hypothetical protein H8959_022482 [Pygathrix nigripes]